MTPAIPPFQDRRDAGIKLAAALMHLKDESSVVLALPRGGVPVAYEVARALAAPLDVLLVRKIGAPGFPELGLGAIVDGEPHQRVLNKALMEQLRPSPQYLADEEMRQLEEIKRRRKVYRGDRPFPPLHGRNVIVVDDGMATGGTMMAALQGLSQQGAAKLIAAVPVSPPEVLAAIQAWTTQSVCLLTPDGFRAVGQYYADFTQTSDEEVVKLLALATNNTAELGSGAALRAVPPDASPDETPPDAGIPGERRHL
jgi:putative phosphoribosyl transferase